MSCTGAVRPTGARIRASAHSAATTVAAVSKPRKGDELAKLLSTVFACPAAAAGAAEACERPIVGGTAEGNAELRVRPGNGARKARSMRVFYFSQGGKKQRRRPGLRRRRASPPPRLKGALRP